MFVTKQDNLVKLVGNGVASKIKSISVDHPRIPYAQKRTKIKETCGEMIRRISTHARVRDEVRVVLE